MLMPTVTRNARITSQPNMPSVVFNQASDEITTQPVPGRIVFSYRICFWGKNGKTIHIAHIYIAIGRNQQRTD